MGDQIAAEKDYKDKLLRMVKKEVKQLMEEAVTRKFVHEESSSITSLCAAVDACLSHGLKRRALGLFKTNSTTALLQKVSKNYNEAAKIARMVAEIENIDPNRSASSSDSTNRIRLKPEKRQVSSPGSSPPVSRFLWIRLALFEKKLAKIVDHLVQHSSKYFEKEALVSDPVSGQILASLLVGPCALDYSKMKTQDHFWTDPPADELVQRHKLSSGVSHNGPSTPLASRRPGLQYKKDNRVASGGSSEEGCRLIPRDYVESLHQNSKSTLLYGKNNVLVQPKEHLEAMPGYLSLHQAPDILIVKWTPNQLMNGCYNVTDSASDSANQDKSTYWEYAISVSVDDIVYLHCHQNADTGGTIVLVGQDGVQQPPFHFPRGGHLLSFLSCLENGLLPHGQMDPPLWSQRGRGKVFPKLRRKGRGSVRRTAKEGEDDEEGASDYVFRIITSLKPDSIAQELLDPKTTRNCLPQQPLSREILPNCKYLKHYSSSSTTSTTSSSRSLTEETSVDVAKLPVLPSKETVPTGQSIQILCNTMKKQIISRAFYGWMAHCRHLRTVRTHLAGLVNSIVISFDVPVDASKGLTSEIWADMHSDTKITDCSEIYRLTYFGGVNHSIRKQVWPYLLGHYAFGSSLSEREEHDRNMHKSYETTMTDWLAAEAIVRQTDKEIMAANLAKLSSESTNSEIPLVGPKDGSLSNDVFEEQSSGESFDHPEEEEEAMQEKSEEEGKPLNEDDLGQQLVDRQDSSDSGHEKHARGRLLRLMPVESQSIIVTNPSVDILNGNSSSVPVTPDPATPLEENGQLSGDNLKEPLPSSPEVLECAGQLIAETHSTCISPASSSGGEYSTELLDQFSLNLHRIDKDVQRCDRNYWYFTVENLEKLRKVMCTYVWKHLDNGYVQGMCDLVAPLLVIFDDEVLTYSCFCELMKRMAANFPYGGAMDAHFANMRSLIQILDAEMFELMHQNGDYTHFYFCYRWFLLDFKRELVYDDVFSIWETIWAAKHIASNHFVLFIALAMVEYYRDIILENNMDFTDIIKFFNEMAERHDAKAILRIARDLVKQIQTLIENK